MKLLASLIACCTVVAVNPTAQATDLAGLKVSMERLDGTQASQIMGAPSAFEASDVVHSLAIVPATDAAPTTTIAWSGLVRASLRQGHDQLTSAAFAQAGFSGLAGQSRSDVLDLGIRTTLRVAGSTQTNLGQFGAVIGLRGADFDKGNPYGPQIGSPGWGTYNAGQSLITADGYMGWWKLENGLTFSGGNGSSVQKGSLVMNQYAMDQVRAGLAFQMLSAGNTYGQVGTNPKGLPWSPSSFNAPLQMALAYNAGPLTLAASVEDAGNTAATSVNALGLAGKVTYKQDQFGLDVSGGYWGPQTATGAGAWNVNAGAGVKFEPVRFNLALGTGNIGDYGTTYLAVNSSYLIGSATLDLALSPTVLTAFGLWHNFDTGTADKLAGASNWLGGLYWNPKKQFTLGLEGQYMAGGVADGSYTTDVVVVWKF